MISSSEITATAEQRYSISPHQPAPQLGICIADRGETTRILKLQGLEREEAIKHLKDECLAQLGIPDPGKYYTARTETNKDYTTRT